MDKEELNHLSDKKNKATQILSLQSKRLRKLKEKELIWEFSFLEMENLMKELYTLQGKNERLKNFPYPRQFATLNHFFVWIFILLLPFGIMTEFDLIGGALLGRWIQLIIASCKFAMSSLPRTLSGPLSLLAL